MKILFLDDSAERIEKAFEHFEDDDVDIVVSAASAIEALRAKRKYDLVMLDHDLGGETWVDSNREDCGMEVVRWIVKKKPKIGRIVVHSWNSVAAPIMVEELKKAGYKATYKPFGFGS
jgi:CheY-like chemotaxis protein